MQSRSTSASACWQGIERSLPPLSSCQPRPRICGNKHMNCDGVRSDRFTIGLVSPRPWRWDVPQGFQHGGSREDVEGHGAEFIAPRAKRFEPLYYSVASTSSPANSVLKFFLNCGRHIFPRLSQATADSSDDCPADLSP